jgi:membrane-associated phospholipid phosphatase
MYDYQLSAQSRCFPINQISNYSVFIGDGKFNLITAGLFSVYGFAASDRRALKTSSNIVESIIATGLLVQVFKRVFGRASPEAESDNSGRWELFPNLKKYQKNQPRYYAFPSGHIATLTTTITVIANNYPEVSWIKPVGYSAIGLVGISLVNKGMHWYSDLPLEFILGIQWVILLPHVKNQIMILGIPV